MSPGKKRRKADSAGKPPAKPSAKGAGGRSQRTALNEDVAREIEALRAALDELVRRYKLEVGGELAELERRLQPDPGQPGKAKLLPVRTAQRVLAAIGDVELRPSRGRPKDFARLKRLVRDVGKLWPG